MRRSEVGIPDNEIDLTRFNDELAALYHGKRNLMVVEMVYLGYFRLGHNVNWRWLM